MSAEETEKEEDPGEPSATKLCKAHAINSPDSVFEKITDEQSSTPLRSAPVDAAIQLELYLGETTTSQKNKPLQRRD